MVHRTALGSFVCVLILAGCNTTRPIPLPAATASVVSARPSAPVVPSGFGPPPGVDTQQLVARDTAQGIVRRVDRVAVKAGGGVWVVVIIGEIKPDTVVDLPAQPCAVFTHSASTGDVMSFQAGPLSLCEPYF